MTEARQCYKAYKDRLEIRSVINNRKFKKRILKLKRSLPNPKTGGWFVSNSGSHDNLGRRFDEPLDPKTYFELELEDFDKVYFEAGQVYNVGSKEITAVGITYGRYGAGDDPIHDGAEDISTLIWTDTGGGIYSTPMDEPKWIVIDELCATNAQTARIPIVSRGSTTSITISHAAVSGYTSIVGAYLTAKETIFKNSQRVKVTAYNGAGVITIDGPIPTANNHDLVLMNDQEFFSANNQWVWAAGTLYIRSVASPSTMNIKAIVHDFSVRTTGSFTAANIEFKHYYTASLWFNGGAPNVQDCAIHDCRDDGILIETGVTGATINDNTFSRIGNNGIFTRPCTSSSFNDNAFTDIGMQGNYHFQTWFDGDGSIAINNNQPGGTAITYVIDLRDDDLTGSNNTFDGNTLNNLAYNGIAVNLGTTGNKVRYNVVDGFCARFWDGAALYNFNYRPHNTYQDGTEFAYNIVNDSNGNDIANGIYCDNRTKSNYVHHNSVSDVYWGIVMNIDTKENIVEDNNVIDCVYCYSFRSGENGTALDVNNDGNEFNRNVAACFIGQKAMLFDLNGSYPAWNPYGDGGAADDNVYIKNAAPSAQDVFDSDNQGNGLELSEIQSAYGEGAGSAFIYANPSMVTNPTNAISNEDANSYYKDFSGTAVESYTIDPYYSRIINELNYSNQFIAASTQYYNAGTTADIQFTHTSTFSIVMRFKIAANPASTQTLFDNRNGSNRGYAIQALTDGRIQIQCVNTVTTNRLQVISSADLCDNAWHQIIFSKTSTTETLDVDGALDTPTVSDNLSATIASTNDLNIGRNAQGGTNYFSGFIDEISIWTSTQSANRSIHWNGGRAIDIRTVGIGTPLHYWRMGLPNSLLDLGTGTPLNLTPVNSPTASIDAS